MFKKAFLFLLFIVAVFANEIDAKIIKNLDFFVNYAYIESDEIEELEGLEEEVLDDLIMENEK